MNTDTSGRAYPNRAAYEVERRNRAAILNPPVPAIKPDAVKISRRCAVKGHLREVNELVMVWPSQPPPLWITSDEARELIQDGIGQAATPEELAAALESLEVEGGAI